MQKFDFKNILVGYRVANSVIVGHEVFVSEKSTIFGAGNSSRNCLFLRLLFEGQLIEIIFFEQVMCENRIAKRNVKINSEK